MNSSTPPPPPPPPPATPPPPPPPPPPGAGPTIAGAAPKKTNWWAIGCGGCLGVLVLGAVLVAVIFYFVIGVIKSTGPYQTAVNTAKNSPEVQAELGTPIEPGFMPSGNVNTNSANGASTGTADLTVPLKGPKGSGKVHYAATKNGDAWEVTDFTVTIDGSGRTIDLQSTPSEPKSNVPPQGAAPKIDSAPQESAPKPPVRPKTTEEKPAEAPTSVGGALK